MNKGIKLAYAHVGDPDECYTEELLENVVIKPIRERLVQQLNGKQLGKVKFLLVGTVKFDDDENTYTLNIGNRSTTSVPWMAEALKVIIAEGADTMDSLMERVIEVALMSLETVAREGVIRMLNNQYKN